MNNKLYKTIFITMISLLLLISNVSAQGTSIILDNDQTTSLSGNALVFCSIAIFIFAALIIIKILLMRGGGN